SSLTVVDIKNMPLLTIGTPSYIHPEIFPEEKGDICILFIVLLVCKRFSHEHPSQDQHGFPVPVGHKAVKPDPLESLRE
ncbi:MAG: hypothetical protein JEY91_13365, partial [Spirochaetaceae bacterium]|nr:hypothetical protein [Spirochaetaceae bacterium]